MSKSDDNSPNSDTHATVSDESNEGLKGWRWSLGAALKAVKDGLVVKDRGK